MLLRKKLKISLAYNTAINFSDFKNKRKIHVNSSCLKIVNLLLCLYTSSISINTAEMYIVLNRYRKNFQFFIFKTNF